MDSSHTSELSLSKILHTTQGPELALSPAEGSTAPEGGTLLLGRVSLLVVNDLADMTYSSDLPPVQWTPSAYDHCEYPRWERCVRVDREYRNPQLEVRDATRYELWHHGSPSNP